MRGKVKENICILFAFSYNKNTCDISDNLAGSLHPELLLSWKKLWFINGGGKEIIHILPQIEYSFLIRRISNEIDFSKISVLDTYTM